MDISKNSVSIAGEFAVLSQLSLRGFDANMTLGNTKSVDILVSNPKNGKMYRLEVKTSYNRKPAHAKLFGGRTLDWVMGEKHETIDDPFLFYCFVNIEKDASSFRFFIVPSHEVATYVKNAHQYWLDRNGGLHKGVITTMRSLRIGIDEKHNIPTPLAKDYENRWDFFANE